MDMMEADKKLIHYWQDNLSRKNNNIKTLLLNTPDDYPYREIENWPHINGVFYAAEDQEHVVSGLQDILRGECYFSQKISQLPDYTLRKLPLQQYRVRITHSSRKRDPQ
nr:regulatory protein [Salmonella sp. NCTC 7297]